MVQSGFIRSPWVQILKQQCQVPDWHHTIWPSWITERNCLLYSWSVHWSRVRDMNTFWMLLKFSGSTDTVLLWSLWACRDGGPSNYSSDCVKMLNYIGIFSGLMM